MEKLVRTIGLELAATESRRRFLGRFGRAVLGVGLGVAFWASGESPALAGPFIECCPECCPPLANCQPGNPGVTCPNCNTVGAGCPNQWEHTYSWWCCGQVGLRECADCKLPDGTCCGCTHNPGGPC
jgi:hypothetical protein